MHVHVSSCTHVRAVLQGAVPQRFADTNSDMTFFPVGSHTTGASVLHLAEMYLAVET